MPTIRVPPGVVRGESKEYVAGRWHETNLVRWQGGLMRPVGGWERQIANALPSLTRNAHVWNDSQGNKHRLLIGDAHITHERNGVYTNLTPADFIDANSTMARGYGSGDYGEKDYGQDDEDRGSGFGAADPERPTRFSVDNWANEALFCSSADGRLFVWDADTPAAAPTVAQGVPPLLQGFLVTDEHHLMTYGGMGTPNRMAWSDQDNRTGWDYTRVTGQAGFYDLEGAGRILSAHKIPGAILVFTSTGIWLGRYIGAPYYYGFNRIAEGCAPISPHAIGVAGQRAFWMGKGSWWKFEGGIVTPMASSLGLEPFESLFEAAAPRRVTAGFNGMYPEIWWFYPEDQGVGPVQTENNRYVIFNFEEGWWADGWMHRTFFMSSPLDNYPLAGDDQGFIYRHETGYLAEGQTRNGMVYAEVGNLAFDDGLSNWQVNQCQVNSPIGPDSVEFEFWGTRARGDDPVFLQKKSPRKNGYLDLHFTAKDFSMKVTGVKDGPWALGAMVFNDVKRRGPV